MLAQARRKLKAEPWLLSYGLRGLWGGLLCRVWHGWVRRKIKAGRLFRVYGKVHFIGPGKVIFGDDVHLLGDMIKPASFTTSHPKARIRVGDHTGINGCSFACRDVIQIGKHCVIAAHYITDNQNHSLYTDRMVNSHAPIDGAPVKIGDNVWVAAQSVIAHGVRIGDNSVIGACSLVRQDVPANVLAAGNPLKVIRPIGPTPATHNVPNQDESQTRTERRLELLHTLRFIANPGNFIVLGRRLLRQILGREVVVDKPGSRLNTKQVDQWLAASRAYPDSHFAVIQEHRRTLATAYRDEMMHAVDRRHATDMSVSERAIAVSLPDEDGRVLYELVRRNGFRACVEMGGAFGVGTRYLAMALAQNGEGELWTIELEQRRQELAMQALGDQADRVHPELGAVEEAMPRLGAQRQDYDFYFIDALHTYEATWGYYELIRRYTAGTCFCVFHDVNSSGPMAKVWKRIVNDPGTLEAMSWRRLGFCLVQGQAAPRSDPRPQTQGG